MKRIIRNLILVFVVVCSIGGYSTDVNAASKMKVTSYERSSAKYTTLWFKPVKKAKRYKIEYYWEKTDEYDISKAYYKIVSSKKVKKKKGLCYVKIPAKAMVQYASVSYSTSSKKGKWKGWSGYTKVTCKHKHTDITVRAIHHDAEYKRVTSTIDVYHPAEYKEVHYKKYKCQVCDEYVILDGATEGNNLSKLNDHEREKHEGNYSYKYIGWENRLILIKAAYTSQEQVTKDVLVKESYDEVKKTTVCKWCGYVK